MQLTSFFQIEKSIWVYDFDDDNHMDFIAFTNKEDVVMYSFELNQFEFGKYCIVGDTVKIIVQDTAASFNPSQYCYLLTNDSLKLIYSEFFIDRIEKERFLSDGKYILYRKKRENINPEDRK